MTDIVEVMIKTDRFVFEGRGTKAAVLAAMDKAWGRAAPDAPVDVPAKVSGQRRIDIGIKSASKLPPVDPDESLPSIEAVRPKSNQPRPDPIVMRSKTPKWSEIYDPEKRVAHPDNSWGLDFIALGEDLQELQGRVMDVLRRDAIADEDGRAYYPHTAQVLADDLEIGLQNALTAVRGLAKKGLLSRAKGRGAVIWVL